MKKKGLIISTVVMVVVLIASLTTATYAWFTTSNKTELGKFNVSVVSGNAVDIGMKKQYGLVQNPTDNDFATGTVTFTTGATNESGPGKIASPGSWTGTDGLSSTIDHNINWGSQEKAVGSTTATDALTTPTNANSGNTNFWVTHTNGEHGAITYGNATTGKTAVIAANKQQGTNELTNQALAKANVNGDKPGDYAHFILGVRPTKALQTNQFVVMIAPTADTQTLGVLASIHVAYRVRKDGAAEPQWTEIDVYGTNKGTTKTGDVQTNVTGALETAYKAATSSTSLPQGSMACVIDGLDLEPNKITQIEVVIYMAGADADCNDQGKTAAGDINLFFNCVDAKTETPTAATVDNAGKLTMTGVNGATVEYKVDNGEWTRIDGTWAGTTFTATAALPDSAKDKTIKVRQTKAGVAASDEFTATNNFKA